MPLLLRQPLALLLALSLSFSLLNGIADARNAQRTKARKTKVLIGLGDNHAEMFSDPQFAALGFGPVRLIVGWDVALQADQMQAADSWIQAALATGHEPMIAFEHSRVGGRIGYLPSVKEYRAAVKAFMLKEPKVRVLEPWNEVNHKSQPTARKPGRAAAYYKTLKALCKRCTIPAADLIADGSEARFLPNFYKALRGPKPRLWGLHNYPDCNRRRQRGTLKFMKEVPGTVWVTETGGVVSMRGERYPYNPKRAAASLAYCFKLLPRYPRITRVYLYQWQSDGGLNGWDSGLKNVDGSARPGLALVEKEMKKAGAKPGKALPPPAPPPSDPPPSSDPSSGAPPSDPPPSSDPSSGAPPSS